MWYKMGLKIETMAKSQQDWLRKLAEGGQGKVFADGKHDLISVSDILFKGQI